MEDKDAVPEAHLITGRALAALGRYPEALRCLEEYLDEHPNSVEGLIAAGLAAAGARELARAIQLFNRAGQRLSAPARALVEPLGSLEHPDPVGLEEMVAEVESHPKDPDRLFAVACALGQAGHFRAVERFLRLLDKQIAESYV
jgi:tetratricopeptide (TPR) repeat protein